ncbi:MAG: hypothetical protein HY673_18995 [Chloroflexi bacterium]|nr:hypothetical protein [Chloroflexota bacterium]
MPVVFRSKLFHQKILDPNSNFEPALLPLEVRWDTLTGHMAIIQEFRFRGQLPKPDYSTLIEKTRPVCPFCPRSGGDVSPRFPPEFIAEGKLTCQGIDVIPNFNPYATYSAIAILSRTHFLELKELSREVVVGGLLACQEYLKRVAAFDRRAKYMSINWNYLPPAGGSVIHPHLQPLASYVSPTYEKEALAALKRYFRRNRSPYWADLITAERDRGERFIGQTGDVAWLVNYAGRGREPDIIAVFPERRSVLDMPQSGWDAFYEGLRNTFRYLADMNYVSFNLALYSAPPGEDQFRVHARLKPRFQFPALGTADYCFIEALHDDYLCQTYPEKVCRAMKPYFGTV